MPAVQPKLPSIWNGGCASNILAYVPPSWSFMVTLGSLSLSWLRIRVKAWLPSSRRAHRHTFHPIDHPRLASPRPTSDFFAAWNSSGLVYGEIWLPGKRPHRCETWRCPLFSLSQSSSHSWSWPYFPMCMGGSCARRVRRVSANSLSLPNVPAASMVLRSRSYIIWLSMVTPLNTARLRFLSPSIYEPSPGWFSGELEGEATLYPVLGSVVRKSI